MCSKDCQRDWYSIYSKGCIIVSILSGIIVCAIGLTVIYLIVSFYYESHYGLNHKGASYKYYTAMCEGNGKEAVIWANKVYEIARKKRYHGYEWRKTYIGYANELNGEYEKALEIYAQFVRGNSFENNDFRFDIMRVHYKLGQRETAFKEYCDYVNWYIDRHSSLKSDDPDAKNQYERKVLLSDIRYHTTADRYQHYDRLNAFNDYQDFLNFMEEEYIKLGSPSEYDSAMKVFRIIKTETLPLKKRKRVGNTIVEIEE